MIPLRYPLSLTCYSKLPGVDGLLGLNFLKRFKLTIRFRKGIINLTKER